jgi:hypothetical protein
MSENEIVIPRKRMSKRTKLFAVSAMVVAGAVFAEASTSDVRALLLEKPDGLFAHLPGDPTLGSGSLQTETSGTLSSILVATSVVLSEDGRAPAEREVLSRSPVELAAGLNERGSRARAFAAPVHLDDLTGDVFVDDIASEGNARTEQKTAVDGGNAGDKKKTAADEPLARRL